MTAPRFVREDVARAVAAAVERGELPPDGPSDVAARDALDHVPADHWQRWSEDAAERIRASTRDRGERP